MTPCNTFALRARGGQPLREKACKELSKHLGDKGYYHGIPVAKSSWMHWQSPR